MGQLTMDILQHVGAAGPCLGLITVPTLGRVPPSAAVGGAQARLHTNTVPSALQPQVRAYLASGRRGRI